MKRRRTHRHRCRPTTPLHLDALESRTLLSAATANLSLITPLYQAPEALTGFTYGDGSGSFTGVFNGGSSGPTGASFNFGSGNEITDVDGGDLQQVATFVISGPADPGPV